MTLSKLKQVSLLLIPANLLLFYIVTKLSNVFFAGVMTLLTVMISIFFIQIERKSLRLKYIEEYKFSDIVIQKFRSEYKGLSAYQLEAVVTGLKQFFMIYSICRSDGKQPKNGFMMPSRIVDELWHNFMLDSQNYAAFCKNAFGGMFHHKPGEDTGGNKKLSLVKSFPTELFNTYKYVKELKHYGMLSVISGVPVLFALDSALQVENGFYYDTQTMQNIELMMLQKTQEASSGSTGSCGGIMASDTVGGCSGGCSGGSCSSGSCGGGCGGGGD